MPVEGLTSASGTGTSGALLQVGVRTTRETNLELTTAEGDRVTISTSAVNAIGLAAASGTSDGTTLSGAALHVEGSKGLSVSVEGNLSQDELQDIAKIVKSFQRAAAKNDASQFLNRLSASDLDTISSVEGSASTETVMTAVVAAGTSEPGAAADATQPTPPPPDAAAGTAGKTGELSESAGQGRRIGHDSWGRGHGHGHGHGRHDGDRESGDSSAGQESSWSVASTLSILLRLTSSVGTQGTGTQDTDAQAAGKPVADTLAAA